MSDVLQCVTKRRAKTDPSCRGRIVTKSARREICRNTQLARVKKTTRYNVLSFFFCSSMIRDSMLFSMMRRVT
jgi:hypothetical protein